MSKIDDMISFSDQAPLVSIITVVRNDYDRLLMTFSSVVLHKGARTEYLLIDGASCDDTLKSLEQYPGLVDRVYSEPDQGIYDAMNKGLAMAIGEYIQYLNAGDELLVDPESLLTNVKDEPVIVYGKANMHDQHGKLSFVKGKPLKRLNSFLKGVPLCHQAILYRRTTMIPYDIRFRIFADRLQTYQILKSCGMARSQFVDGIMVNYYGGGFSDTVTESARWEEEDRFYDEVGAFWYKVKKKLNRLFKIYVKSIINI